jgi:hypothetical protein
MTDRERLLQAYERNKEKYARRAGKERGPEIRRVTLSAKRWLIAGAGLFSFLVTTITALSALSKVDDLRVATEDHIKLYKHKSGASIGGTENLTLINQGNQSATILDMSLFVRKESEGENVKREDGCRKRQYEMIKIDLAWSPLVIKPNEIQSVSVGVRDRHVRLDENGVPYISSLTLEPYSHYFTCLAFHFVTPGHSSRQWMHAMNAVLVLDDSLFVLNQGSGFGLPPMIIWRQWRTPLGAIPSWIIRSHDEESLISDVY